MYGTYDLSQFHLAALIAAGIASGFINTVAGGGSLLTLPALMLIGLPADLANGTNRLSVLAQSASTVHGFHSAGKFDTKAAVAILGPAVAGSLAGSVAAAWLPPGILKPALLVSMVAITVLVVARPDWMTPPEDQRPYTVAERPSAVFWLFGVGVYGGFVQGGVGFLSLMLLCGLLRYDLVRAHALKIAISGVFGVVPLAVFLFAGQVLWIPGLILAAATVVGSRLGVRFAIGASQQALRWFLLVAVVVATAAAFIKG
ncbi:MAG: sulfite exporter TauE/SafE family protein [Deltaproteobacteria bacterium]|nr:sulfite exporter TauE/SafE family protein [Deltaproteobacteria bacterium]